MPRPGTCADRGRDGGTGAEPTGGRTQAIPEGGGNWRQTGVGAGQSWVPSSPSHRGAVAICRVSARVAGVTPTLLGLGDQ